MDFIALVAWEMQNSLQAFIFHFSIFAMFEPILIGYIYRLLAIRAERFAAKKSVKIANRWHL